MTRERERDIFSGAVREGDRMEHHWEGVCVCVCVCGRIKRRYGEGGMFLTHKGVT